MSVQPPAGGIVPPPPPMNYAQPAVDAVVEAYYPRAVAAVDAARARAQSAYAIASTLAGVLVGAGLLTTLEERPNVVKAIGCMALIAWLIAAGSYLFAVASPITTAPATAQKGATNFVNNVLNRAAADRIEIDKRLGRANSASIVALALTALAVGLALFVVDEPKVDGTVVLSSGGVTALAEICPVKPNQIDGSLTKDTVGTETIRITADAGQCDEVRIELDIPRSAVAAVRLQTR